MILVIGATGMLGSEICRQLSAKKQSIRAMIRNTSDPAKRKNLEDLGVQITQGDLRDKSTFKNALKGISTVITTISSMPFSYVPGKNDIENVDLHGMINLIDHAKETGIKRFIYTSFSGQIDLNFPLRNAKRTIEEYLKKSGMVYTILRPSFFIEVWLTAATGFDTEHGKVQICGDGTMPVSYISYKDVAEFAVESLDNMAARSITLELGGPEKISQLNVVKIFEKVTGKKYELQHLSQEILKSQIDTATDPMQKSFSGLMLCLANGDPIDMKKMCGKFPIKLTSVWDFAKNLKLSTETYA